MSRLDTVYALQIMREACRQEAAERVPGHHALRLCAGLYTKHLRLLGCAA